MEVIRKAILCKSRLEYYELHLAIINPLLPNRLTEKEILILASFMSIDEKLVEDDRFNSLVRKKVMQKHNLSAGGLGNYLKSMIKKGFLSKSNITGRIKIKDFMLPSETKQGYEFKIGYKPVEQTSAVEEKESPLDKIIPAQRQLNKMLAEKELKSTELEKQRAQEYPLTPKESFHKSEIIDDEDENFEEEEDNDTPYKMS